MYINKKFIVTGGVGFIGTNLIKELNRQGYEDIVVVDNLNNISKFHNLNEIKFTEFYDKNDFMVLLQNNKIQNVDYIIHLGACSSTTENNKEYLLYNNFYYTKILCEWAIKNNSRFIYASSAATYGDGSMGYFDNINNLLKLKPLNLYGWSKHLFDVWALENNLLNKIAGLKYFNVYGPYEEHKKDMCSLINKAYKQILRDNELTLFRSYNKKYKDGEQERDFIYVKDVVRYTLSFCNNLDKNGIFNCGTGKSRTWIDIATIIFNELNKDINIRFIDMPEYIKDKYQYHTKADMGKLETVNFYSLENGIKEYINYLKGG